MVRLDGLPSLNIVEMTQRSEQGGVLQPMRHFTAHHVDKVVREAGIEIIAFLNVRNILRTKLQAECFDIGLEMSYYAATDKWVYVGRLWSRKSVHRMQASAEDDRPSPSATRMQWQQQLYGP